MYSLIKDSSSINDLSLDNKKKGREEMKAMRWLTLVAGILLIVLGMFMFGTPTENLVVISFAICFSLIIYGVITICSYFSFEKGSRSSWMLVFGILSVLLGVWMLASGDFWALTAVLPFVFSIWLVVSSISMAVKSIDFKDLGVPGWGWQLAFGIIGVVVGFLLISAPLTSALTLSYTLAFMFVYRGVADIVLFFTLRKKNT